MQTVTAYQVHANLTIVRMRRSRLRGGISFGAVPITVALEPAPGVHEVVTREQLAEILGDTYLKHTKLTLAAQQPSLEQQLQAEAKAEKAAAKGKAKAKAPAKGAKGKAKQPPAAAATAATTGEGAAE